MNYGYAHLTDVLCEDCAFVMRLEAGMAHPDADPLELPNSIWPTGPFRTSAEYCTRCEEPLREAPCRALMQLRGLVLARVLGGAQDGAEFSNIADT